MRLWVKPLPAIQLITACLVWMGTWLTKFRVWVRTCSRTGQILWLLLAGLLAICICVARRRKRLAICTVHWWGLAHTAPDGMRRDESLCLRRNWGEDTILVESHTI